MPAGSIVGIRGSPKHFLLHPGKPGDQHTAQEWWRKPLRPRNHHDSLSSIYGVLNYSKGVSPTKVGTERRERMMA